MSRVHPIAGYGFLLLVACAIGFGAKAGLQHSKETAVAEGIAEAERQAKNGNAKKAAETLREVLQEQPSNLKALFNLGLVQLELGEHDDADQSFAKLLAIVPDDYEAMAVRALILKKKGKVEESLAALEKIPVGKGRVKELLETDATWEDLDGNPRMNSLRERVGLPPLENRGADTSLNQDDDIKGSGGTPTRRVHPPVTPPSPKK